MMLKPFTFLMLLAAMPFAQAFELKAGNWQWAHTISWQERDSGRSDGVEGKENLCVSRQAAADYAKAQADELRAEKCTVSDFAEQGDTASFRAACEEGLSFEMRYQKTSPASVRFTQTVLNPKGRNYTADGVMQYQNDDLAACEE